MERTFPARPARRTSLRRGVWLAAIIAPAMLLAGCSGGGPRLTCPTAVIAPDLETVALLRPGGSAVRDIQAAAKINAVANKCESENGGIDVNTQVDFVILRSSIDVKRSDFPYFVAVVDAQRNILNEEVFRLAQEYVPRQTSRGITEQITEHLPVKDVSTGGSYFIVVGFKLTPEQLDFNRKQKAQAQ